VSIYYEINVARNGEHLFATAKRSLESRDKAWSLFHELAMKFPRATGHVVSVTRWSETGEPIISTDGECDA